MSINYSNLITDAELLDFSQNLSVQRNYLGNRLFPDRKTQYVFAEYSRVAKGGTLPTIAPVHALDTEAYIASRLPFDKIRTETLLIKEKINVTEAIRKITNGMGMDGVKEYVFDDVARMAEGVITRAEVAKMEVLTSGQLAIDENGATFTVDYGVPAGNKDTASWGKTSDILGDIGDWYAAIEAAGLAPDTIVTTRAIFSMMCKNTKVQTAIFGTAGAGTIPTRDQVNNLLSSMFDGLTLEINEARYGIEGVDASGKATVTAGRMFPAGKFVMFASGSNGALGAGIWGVTPEEEAQGGAFDALRQQQFVTVTQWNSPDPVAHWTKASGMFIPALANPNALAIADITISEG